MPTINKREEQPWLRYLVLPFVLILFGLAVSYALLAQQKQTNPASTPPVSSIPTPTPTPSKNITGFICPASGWINCMPILTQEAAKLCTPQAIAWFKKNCPDFKGTAY